jgi:hypothetical protein
MEQDRLRRVEMEVETLLADVRQQVQGLRATVERMRAYREPDHPEDRHATRH